MFINSNGILESLLTIINAQDPTQPIADRISGWGSDGKPASVFLFFFFQSSPGNPNA